MISRRVIRIKVMQMIYAYTKADNQSIDKYEKDLIHSIDKTYSLFDHLVTLIIEIADHAQSIIDQNKQKRIPTADDLNPNTRFVNNKIIQQLREHGHIKNYLSKNSSNWTQHPELIKNLYNEIKEQPFFQDYMTSEKKLYEQDKKVLIDIYSRVIVPYEPLHLLLEDSNIFWNDEIEFVTGNIIKMFKKMKDSDTSHAPLSVLAKNPEDLDYARTLLKYTIANNTEYITIIDQYTDNWEIERIAEIDLILLQMALCELLRFPSIPVKVTLNEYLDIAKEYSTSKSNTFLNGVLDKIVHAFKKEDRIKKSGKGLIGDLEM